MPHNPYGYRIVDGKAEIDEKQAMKVRDLFENYISGMGLKAAAEKAGLPIYHGSAGRMLRNTHYLGDEYYPAIIDKETFDKAEERRQETAKYLNKYKELKPQEKPPVPTNFSMAEATERFATPYRQAEYLYGLIESEA